jgi:hypothetical protein
MSTSTELRSRRALMGAGLGALAATVASALGRPQPAQATHGDVHLGAANTASSPTKITNNYTGVGLTVDRTGIWGESLSGIGVRASGSTGAVGRGTFGAGVNGVSTLGGPGIHGVSENNATGVLGFSGSASGPWSKDKTGVYGEAVQDSNSRGVWGRSNAGRGIFGEATTGLGVVGSSSSSVGVRGLSTSGLGMFATSAATNEAALLARSNGNSTGVLGLSGDQLTDPVAAKANTGVYGQATKGSGSRGVWGRSNSGRGVFGEAKSGAGVYGQATTGYAIRGNGRVRLDKVSGVATIPAGATSVVVSPGVNVIDSSFVLLTPMANIGSRALWFTKNVSADTITIRLSSSRDSSTKIAWLLLG